MKLSEVPVGDTAVQCYIFTVQSTYSTEAFR